jgi:hypothetical protein
MVTTYTLYVTTCTRWAGEQSHWLTGASSPAAMVGGGAGMAAEAPFLAMARCVEVCSGSAASRRTQEGKKGEEKGEKRSSSHA